MVKIIDNLVDVTPKGEIGNILKITAAGKSMTPERKKALLKLKEFLEKNKCETFQGDFRTFGLATIGSFAIFKVLKGQRGHLAKFSGKLMLIICVNYADKWPGYANRKFAALPVRSNGELQDAVEGKK